MHAGNRTGWQRGVSKRPDVIDTARTLAAAQPGGRLDPPLLLLLDEAANIAPIPSLPNLMSDGAGTGITTVTVLQSLAQARARWGDAGADAMWDASTTKVILGGLAHADDLQRISRLAGDIDVPQFTRSTSQGAQVAASVANESPHSRWNGSGAYPRDRRSSWRAGARRCRPNSRPGGSTPARPASRPSPRPTRAAVVPHPTEEAACTCRWRTSSC